MTKGRKEYTTWIDYISVHVLIYTLFQYFFNEKFQYIMDSIISDLNHGKSLHRHVNKFIHARAKVHYYNPVTIQINNFGKSVVININLCNDE